MVLILKVLAALNMVACVFSIFNKFYIVALLDLIVSLFTYAISRFIESNNEIYDFFENYNDNDEQETIQEIRESGASATTKES